MNAYVFPGQGAQFPGMGKDLYDNHGSVKNLMERANDVLGFRLTDIMFDGSEEDLKQTNITQPAIFVHSIAKAEAAGDTFRPDCVAGHSLGEFSALVASRAITFADGLVLVSKRAGAMQHACDQTPGTMAAIVGLEDQQIEDICAGIDGVVVPANYNCPGQLVISGEMNAIDEAIVKLTEAGAKRAIKLNVGGAFHSPLMKLAEDRLREAIESTPIKTPQCPVYQNYTASPEILPEVIKENLINQLTGPVKWTQTMQNMISDGVDNVIECGGAGKVLRGFFKRVDRKLPSEAL